PRVPPTQHVLAPDLWGHLEVCSCELDQVGGRLAGQHPVHDALVIRVAIRLAREDPGTWFGAEDVFPAQVLDDARSIRARGTIRQDDLAQIAKPGHGCPLRGPFDSGPARPPAFRNPLPHRVEQIPRVWILLAKPRAFLRTGK